MIVRTYGRRNPAITRTYSDSLNDAILDDPTSIASFSPSQPLSHQDFYSNLPFSSQESSSSSSSLFPSFDPDPFSFDCSQDNSFSNGAGTGVSRNCKKPRNASKLERPPKSRSSNSSLVIPVTATLMEAQEFGEMMEHVDEINFALDGLRRGQQVRIKRASLLSLLSICGTAQQRRLLRAQGMAKTIIDAILGLSFNDTPSSLAAAALFYVLTVDGQDDHLLESPSCIRFLIKLLKPVISNSNEDKGRNIGCKLLALRKDSDVLRDTNKLVDSSSNAIATKVQEILVSSKDMKTHNGDNSGVERPELCPKWIALLTMEKACLSKLSFEDASGSVRNIGGSFKEKLREMGALDAVVEVAVNCHNIMESWKENSLPSVQDAKHDLGLQNLMLLLKCLKIMENATFLSKDNQIHLLGMKGSLDSYGCRLSFTKLIISIIKILSGLYLVKSSAASSDQKPCSLSDGSNLALLPNDKVDSNAIISISSTNCSRAEGCSPEQSFNMHQKFTSQFSHSVSCSETTTTLMNNGCQLKTRVFSSMSSSSSETLRRSNGGTPVTSNGLGRKFVCDDRPNHTKDAICDISEDMQDPFAFDDDEFKPSKWDLLYGKQKPSRKRAGRSISREFEERRQYQLMSQEESNNGGNSIKELSEVEYHPPENSCSNATDEERTSLLAECLLTAIKVLMNLTNENPIGCRQIASCGGLETMTSLIAGHFPLFSSSISSISENKEGTFGFELEHQNDKTLTDQELDFLVAILGLLVNLVEKDEHNRSRLANARVSLPSSEGLELESKGEVIPLLCSIFLANQGGGDAFGEENILSWDDEAALLREEKEAEKMIVEAYAALLLAFLSTESRSTRNSIANCLPNHNLAILVPVLERFLTFHLTLNMISPETHKAVNEVIESCRLP